MRIFQNLGIILFFCLLNSSLFAAVPPPPPPGNGPPCWPPPCIPIDGGVSFLVAAGAAYGAKKLYDSRKKKSTQE